MIAPGHIWALQEGRGSDIFVVGSGPVIADGPPVDIGLPETGTRSSVTPVVQERTVDRASRAGVDTPFPPFPVHQNSRNSNDRLEALSTVPERPIINTAMPRFEINFLDNYTDEALVDEIRRVATQLSGTSLSAESFAEISGRVSISTIRRRFGTWRLALSKAGLEHLYGGRKVSEKMKQQPAKRLSKDDLIDELKRVHAILGTETMNRDQFNANSITSYEAIRRRFGWYEALKLAGIAPAPSANRKWTIEDCFENLATVWTHYGRPPSYREMFEPPSIVSGKGYDGRWGTWRKALRAFVEWSNLENDASTPGPIEPPEPQIEALIKPNVIRRAEEDNRQVGPRLRFRVFQRDRFKCVACGRSPATDLNIILHADHITPVALGGKTKIENLQTLCEGCNLGKGMLPPTHD